MVDKDFVQEEYNPTDNNSDESINFEYKEPVEEKKVGDEIPKTEVKKDNIQSKLPVSENNEKPKISETNKKTIFQDIQKSNVETKKRKKFHKKSKKVSNEKKPNKKKTSNKDKKIKISLNSFKKYIQFPKRKKKKSKAKLKNIPTIAAVVAIIVIIILVLNINKIFPDKGTPIAIVNNEIITSQDIDRTIKTIPPEYGFSLTDEEILNQTIMNALLMQEAKKLGLEATNAEVQQTINQVLLTNQQSLKEFKDNLKLQGLTMKDMEEFYRIFISISKLAQTKIYPNIAITPEEVKEVYDNSDIKENATFEEVEQQIIDFVTQQKQVEALNDYISELMNKADIKILSEEAITQTSFSSEEVEKYSTCAVENGLTKDTILFVYSDTCPHCQRMKPIVVELEVEEYNFKWISASDNEAKIILRNCFSDVLAGGVPQFICAKNGQTIVGETPKEILREFADNCK